MSIEIRVPQLGESIVEATVGQWLKHEGDTVQLGEPLVELETDKVNLEVSAVKPGTLETILRQEGETVGVDDVLATLAEASGQAAPPPAAAPIPPAATAAEEVNAPTHRASPVVRNLADQLAVDLHNVAGSGPGGRVIRSDIEQYAQQRQAEAPAPPSAHPPVSPVRPEPAASAASTPAAAGERRVRLSQRRLTIARRLVEAQHIAAMLTTFNEIDMSVVQDLRHRWRERFKERYGVNLGLMSFFTKAAVGALKAFPQVNAEIQGQEMVLKEYYDIGIAVGTDQGLVVPVVRRADQRSFAEIEKTIRDFAARARQKQLTLEDLQGGTFTITNGGTYGSMLSTPILNAPQVGILGLHKIEQRPVAIDGQVIVRPMMYVALTYDHRLVDGSDAVRFLVMIKTLMEDPESLLLEA